MENQYNLLVELTQKCNLNCEYCFYRDYGRKATEMNCTMFKNIINSFGSIKNIYLTGGECTLNFEFLQIIKVANEKSKVTLFTNGLKLNDESFYNSIDKFIHKYIITLDTFETDYLCRKETLTTLEVIKKILSKTPEKLIVKVCINAFNSIEIEPFLNFLCQIGVKTISINLIHNINTNTNNFELSKKELERIFSILENFKNVLFMPYFKEIKDFYINGNRDIKKFCRAGNDFFYFDCEGNKKNCPASFDKDKNCISKECISLFELF